MKLAVLGLWHLGAVTAACSASIGHDVTGWDPDLEKVEGLIEGIPPIAEPDLEEILRGSLTSGRLRFTPNLAEAVADAEVVWLTFDTPVDDEDRADVDVVIDHLMAVLPFVTQDALVLVSSQLPVGSVAAVEQMWTAKAPASRISFACSPENLRLGKAIGAFMNPDRVIVGVRRAADKARIAELFAPITERIEWMSVESAEMTKHAINAFLATSVSFINELATLCEAAGADAKEVERGLKSEPRIGWNAYLSPGAAFAGGTLARDVVFLKQLGRRTGRPTALFDGVENSNKQHRDWPRQRLVSLIGPIKGKTVAVWGLTYKPGTNTLRRSTSVELCRWLLQQGALVRAHDPAATALPGALDAVVRVDTPIAAARDADALVIGTDWPLYRSVEPDALAAALQSRLVLDPNRFLQTLRADRRFRVVSVGEGPK